MSHQLIIYSMENDEKLASSFYTTFADIISLLYMFTSAIRLLIYVKCNPSLRLILQGIIKNMCILSREKNYMRRLEINVL